MRKDKTLIETKVLLKGSKPTHTQGEIIANSVMPFILLGIMQTEESRREVNKGIAKSIDHAIEKSKIGMIRLDEKVNKAVNSFDDMYKAHEENIALLTELKKIRLLSILETSILINSQLAISKII